MGRVSFHGVGRSGGECRRRSPVSTGSVALGIRLRLTRSVKAMVRAPSPPAIARRENAEFVGRAPRTPASPTSRRDRQRHARPRARRDRQERPAARDPPPRRRRLGPVRARRARPAAGAGRCRAGAGRRVERGAAAGPDRQLRAHERARRLPALDAAAVAARRAPWSSIAGRDAPEPAGSRAAGRPSRANWRWPRSASTRRARCSSTTAWSDDPRAAAIARWASGLPLALRLGAAARARRSGLDARADAAPLRAHLRRVSDVALDGEFADVFALACVARVVTPALIIDVLPASTPRPRCAGSPAARSPTPRPGGVTLHDLVRRPLRASCRQRARPRARRCGRASPTACTPARSPASSR